MSEGMLDKDVCNPPFGKQSRINVVNEEGKADRESSAYERTGFFTTASGKQLNFPNTSTLC